MALAYIMWGIYVIVLPLLIVFWFFKKEIMKHILILVLIFCIICLLLIGFKLNPLPCPECFGDNFADGVNDILKNLSYSYVAGYIIYWFTVLIPEKKEKEIVLPTLKNEVIALWHPIQNLFNWYIGTSAEKQELATKENIAKAIQDNYSSHIKYDQTTNNILLLKIRLDEFKSKASFLFQKNKYFTARQYDIINKIITKNYNLFSTFAKWDLKDDSLIDSSKNQVSDLLWEIIEEYIELRKSFEIEEDLYLNNIHLNIRGRRDQIRK